MCGFFGSHLERGAPNEIKPTFLFAAWLSGQFFPYHKCLARIKPPRFAVAASFA